MSLSLCAIAHIYYFNGHLILKPSCTVEPTERLLPPIDTIRDFENPVPRVDLFAVTRLNLLSLPTSCNG